MPDPEILPGAEPFSASGGAHGALVLHGFTGCPQSMRGLAQAFAAGGFSVELPLLPGHGTSVDDMATTRWDDWSGAVAKAYAELASRCDRVVVAGLSMGGALALWLAGRQPELAGIVVINAVAAPPDPDPSDGLRGLLEQGTETIPGVGNDVADPVGKELAYDQVPIPALLSMFAGLGEVAAGLGAIRCPTLILTSPQDHVVQPAQSDLIAERVAGPVERVTLDRSYHVATLDYDKELIEQQAVAFAKRVTGPEA